MADFSHLKATGEAQMVDVSGKAVGARQAAAIASVEISRDCLQLLDEGTFTEIARTARIAGIQAAKQTASLIPMCHPVPLSKVDITIVLDRDRHSFEISAEAKTHAVTGVEMEALLAASIAALTIYDMIKAVDPGAAISRTRVERKDGGKSGPWIRGSEGRLA